MRRRYAIVFICQQGRLEAQAAVLAASLRRFARFECELIAAVPTPVEQWGKPGDATLAYLAGMGVRVEPITNQLDATYAIGNKVGCLSIKTDADKLIFLDSDMVVMRPWEDEARFGIAFNARPASVSSFSDDGRDWEAVYAACGAKALPGRVRTTFSGQLIAPYFNSAFVAVAAKSGFGEVWLDCCRKIEGIEVPKKRPHLDQIALSPAISRLGMEYDCLDERYNHPINFKPLGAGPMPLICHYHDAMTLAREPAAVAVVRELAARDAALSAIVSADAEWRDVVGAAGEKLAMRGLNLIITGIPRSGTSYLCNLLHRHRDCVVINEPPEVMGALQQGILPWGAAAFFGDIRRDILLGKPIENYLTDGKVTEDTAVSTRRVAYLPAVSRGDFVLGMKWPIPFLTRLEQLRRVLPDARMIACVRNPFDTIASWKTTFPRLRDADIRGKPVGNPADPWLSGTRREELGRIADIGDVGARRAAWWRYLAERVIEAREYLTVLRYEEMVRDPRGTMARIFAGMERPEEAEAIEASEARSKAESLDAGDIEAIKTICAEPAKELGIYWGEA